MRGESDIEDVPSEQLARSASAFAASTDPAALGGCDAILICVPTPLANQREPDLSYITASAGRSPAVLRGRADRRPRVDDLPGHDPRGAAAAARGVRAAAPAQDFHLAYSPERIDPGRTDHTVANTPKVVGGITTACAERAAADLRQICEQVVARLEPRGGGADEAAREHLPLGQHRPRQRARPAHRPARHRHLGGDRRRLDQAVRLHALRARSGHGRPLPAGRPLLPRLQGPRARLLHRVRRAGRQDQPVAPAVLRRARSSAPSTTASKPVKGSKVLILGVSYKAGVADLRESPALKIIRHLRELGAEVTYHDPHVAGAPRARSRSADLEQGRRRRRRGRDRHRPSRDRLRGARSAAALVVDFRGVTRGLERRQPRPALAAAVRLPIPDASRRSCAARPGRGSAQARRRLTLGLAALTAPRPVGVAGEFVRRFRRRSQPAPEPTATALPDGTVEALQVAGAARVATRCGSRVEGYGAASRQETVLFNLFSGFVGAFAFARLSTQRHPRRLVAARQRRGRRPPHPPLRARDPDRLRRRRRRRCSPTTATARRRWRSRSEPASA